MVKVTPKEAAAAGASEEEWIFSLRVPQQENKLLRLVAKQTAADTTEFLTDASSGRQDSKSNGERASLLNNQQQEVGEGCAWKLTSPFGLVLQSSIVLELSYRPAWQGIPEYTQRQSQRWLAVGCCRDSEVDDNVREVYTAQHIVDAQYSQVTIRGVGPCQAVQLFLEPHAKSEIFEELPYRYQEAMNRHRQRTREQPNPTWSRFTEPGDSIADDDNEHRIMITFAIPLNTEDRYDPPLLWKVDLPSSSFTDVCMDTITVFDGDLQLQEPATHIYIQVSRVMIPVQPGPFCRHSRRPTPLLLFVYV
jgi:hypothetical protein